MKAENKHNIQKRISLKKALLVSSCSALVVSKGWHKPVVRAIILPAHAQTTPTTPTTTQEPMCPSNQSSTTVTALQGSSGDLDSIDIYSDVDVDGCPSLELSESDNVSTTSGVNRIFSLDVDGCVSDPDSDTGRFDVENLGSDDWDIIADGGLIGSNTPAGSFTVTVRRVTGEYASTDYILSVEVVIDSTQCVENGGNGDQMMTVTASITPL